MYQKAKVKERESKIEGEGMKKEEDEPFKKKKEGDEKKGWSEIRLAVEELSLVKHDKVVSTLAFLSVSNLLLQVLDKIGPTMAVLRQDVQRNIERLQELYVSDPSRYSSLAEILKKEVSEGTTRKPESHARAMLWLTRSMDFSIAVLDRLEKNSELNLVQVVEDAYKDTLKPWHGWISSAAYKVALKLIPERKIFISILMGKGQDYNMLKADIQNLVLMLQSLLNESHALFRKFRLDRLKST
ncbi:glycolipid transfer protein 3 [Elaeis guineensis]|uniref:Glycolipid transfer protein 3 n=1 Tax=Elaeis guineensis var. tenera TaxID=51953 RepID=A0A6I9RR39_ELAGV|nr:glycolipid transfer protein 3 [Elaeis guineensis]XP_010930619.1 glycolipid transfer protein 3 [Elaeis guineensis]